ncbi:MAG: permease [Methanolinea sp.]|nr:permease [Methanolinea sp.]
MTAINDLFTAGQFFLVITLELVLLFLAISFLVGLIQEYIPEGKIRRALSSRHRVTGTSLGAFFGALTPFCSCSTIPVLVGLINSRVPFGACMAFLLASPLLNPVIVFMMLAFFGPIPTIIYCAITFCIAVISGILLEERGYIRFVKPVGPAKNAQPSGAGQGCCTANPVFPVNANTGCCPGNPFSPDKENAGKTVQAPACGCSCGSADVPAKTSLGADPGGKNESTGSFHAHRIKSALGFSFRLFRQLIPYLVLGAAIGAFIYGFVPEDLIVSLAGPENPLAIPVAAIIGIPMYIRAETIIPISAVLLAKGMGLGAVMALIIGGAGASIPEVTLLASIFERRLVAAFVLVVLGVAISAGVILQVLQASGLLG